MSYKINEDLYIGNTNKQLKDIETNANNIATNTTNIATILNRGYIAVNYNSSTCQTRTWQFAKISGGQVSLSKGNFTFSSNEVIIGKGISLVLVGGYVSITLNGGANWPDFSAVIGHFRNGTKLEDYGVYQSVVGSPYYFGATIPMQLIPVQENDHLILGINGSKNTDTPVLSAKISILQVE